MKKKYKHETWGTYSLGELIAYLGLVGVMAVFFWVLVSLSISVGGAL